MRLSAVLFYAAVSIAIAQSSFAQTPPPENSEGSKLEQIQAKIRASRSETAKTMAAVGRMHLKAGRFEEATQAFLRAAEIDPDSPDIQLSIGTAQLRGGKYEEAKATLGAYVASHPDSVEALFLLALARIELAEFEVAALELERVSEHQGSLQSLALIQLGRVRELLGDLEAARSAFRGAVDVSPDKTTAAQAQSLLNNLNGGERRYRLNASFAALYDDNVVTAEIDSSTGAKDAAAEFAAGGSYRLIDSEDYQLEAGYNFFQTLYSDYEDFNLQLHTFSVNNSSSFENFDVSLGYAYTLARLGAEPLLGTHSLSPTFQFLAQPWWYVYLNPRVAWKDFEDNDRDAFGASASALNFFFLPKQIGHVQLNLGYDFEDADAPRFDHHAFRTRVSIHIPVLDLFDFDVHYRYRVRDYTNRTPLIDKERLDRTHTTGVRLTRDLGRGFKLRIEYEHENSGSNLPSGDFTQNHVRAGVRWAM